MLAWIIVREGDMIPNSFHLEYASGYLTLGMLDDASDELEKIDGDARLSVDVLGLRVDLYYQAKE